MSLATAERQLRSLLLAFTLDGDMDVLPVLADLLEDHGDPRAGRVRYQPRWSELAATFLAERFCHLPLPHLAQIVRKFTLMPDIRDAVAKAWKEISNRLFEVFRIDGCQACNQLRVNPKLSATIHVHDNEIWIERAGKDEWPACDVCQSERFIWIKSVTEVVAKNTRWPKTNSLLVMDDPPRMRRWYAEALPVSQIEPTFQRTVPT